MEGASDVNRVASVRNVMCIKIPFIYLTIGNPIEIGANDFVGAHHNHMQNDGANGLDQITHSTCRKSRQIINNGLLINYVRISNWMPVGVDEWMGLKTLQICLHCYLN